MEMILGLVVMAGVPAYFVVQPATILRWPGSLIRATLALSCNLHSVPFEFCVFTGPIEVAVRQPRCVWRSITKQRSLDRIPVMIPVRVASRYGSLYRALRWYE